MQDGLGARTPVRRVKPAFSMPARGEFESPHRTDGLGSRSPTFAMRRGHSEADVPDTTGAGPNFALVYFAAKPSTFPRIHGRRTVGQRVI
ncbi:hypothetical protein BDI4_730033 [Burkholderia diffusa]|nr:hypothetical protein BDI4_730033 [Burkholderia diffusa]